MCTRRIIKIAIAKPIKKEKNTDTEECNIDTTKFSNRAEKKKFS